MKKLGKIKFGSSVKMLTFAAGIASIIGMIINSRLEDAKMNDIKESAREEARQEVKKAFAEMNHEEEV